MVFTKIFALCIVLLICPMAVGDEALSEQQVEKSIPVDGALLIKIQGINGDIMLSPWEKSEVLVKATKIVKTDDNEKAQEYFDKIDVIVERIDDRIEVKTEQPQFLISGGLEFWVDYDIYAPEDMDLDLEVTNENGSVLIFESRGKTKVNTKNGSIELINVAGSVSAETANGDIIAEVITDEDFNFASVNGSIEIYTKDALSVPISASTVSGSIKVSIPEGFSADLDAGTLSGQVNCDFPVDGLVQERSIEGKIFGGGPPMKLKTINGNVTIGYYEEQIEEEAEIEETPVDVAQPSRLVTGQISTEQESVYTEQGVPYVNAIRTLSPPTIDGRLDDDCWKNAGRIENFVWANGIEEAYEPTEAYLLWDDHNLYIGIKCYESSMDTIRVSNTEPDKAYWEDDMVQIFIEPPPEMGTGYYHITVNPIGTVFDQKIEGESNRGLGLISWNSNGLFDNDIRSDSWSIEAGIPFSALRATPAEGDVWRFNLYRMEKARGEHTYWSPTYAEDDWPHVPDKFGELVFASGELVEEEPLERPDSAKEALTISHITIKGNNRISEEEILGALELRIGDLADVDNLSRARLRLLSLGWFRSVGMDLAENENGVDLVVKVVEKDIISVSRVQVQGATRFSADQIIDYFNFGPSTTTKSDIDTRCRLIERLYRVEGYEMATVNCSVISNALIVDINEGRIDKIEISGNKRVHTSDIERTLDLKPGTPYQKSRIEGAINTMKARIPFRRVHWGSRRSDDGLNVLHIDVEERLPATHNIDPVWDFNRVHGLRFGLKGEVKSTYGGSRSYAKLLYGFSSEMWDYQFGVEQSWFAKHKSTIGFDVHRITDTSDWELISDAENFIAEAILGEAWRDFYQRKGYELSFGQKLASSTEFGFRYNDDKYRSLWKTEDWSLLNRSYQEEDWYDEFRWSEGRMVYTVPRYRFGDDDNIKPENPPIIEGRMKSVTAEYTIDTRNTERDPSNGWLNTFSVERGNYVPRDSRQDDYDFTIYNVNIRRYNRLSGNQFLTFRIKAATADRELPDSFPEVLHPRRFYLGGIGTLRGYQFKEFAGDKMALINAEYWVMTRWPPGLGIVFFVDSGYAWPYDVEVDIDDMKTDVGFGFQWGALRVNLASPVNEEEDETNFVVSARLARMF